MKDIYPYPSMKNPPQTSSLRVLSACFLSLLVPLHAATITDVGHQVDIEADADTLSYTVSKEVGVPIGLINISMGNRTSQNAFCKTAYRMVVLLRPNPQ